MATAYKSDAARKNYVARPLGYNKYSFVATCEVAAGVPLAVGDTFDFFTLGENVNIESLTVVNSDFDDSTDTLYDLGYVGGTDVTDFFVDGSTALQTATLNTYAPVAAHGVVFADGVYVPNAAKRIIRATIMTAPVTQTTADNAIRKITLAAMLFRDVPQFGYNAANEAAYVDIYTPPTP